MNRAKKPAKYQLPKSYRFLANVALLANGFFLLAAPALAQTTPPTPPTAANTVISNQATATYQDPNDPPGSPPINATSNTVTITVAEVAGIFVQAGTVNDINGGTVLIGDALEYNFTITNVGNDPTRFQIPSTVTVSGKGTVVAGSLEYQNPGSSTWNPVPASGGATTNSVPVNGNVLVRVRVTVNSDAVSSDIISVRLGETAGNQSNVPRISGEINDALDVYTVDNANGVPDEISGSPANGVVEGSAVAQKTVSPKNYSLATLLKTRGTYSNNNTPGTTTDDTLAYNLGLRVESTDITGKNITPSPLAGSTVPGLSGTNILVSDAIPTGTQLNAVPTAPTGWTAVYSTTDVTTSANAATWTTTAPADLATVKRVGFIKPTTDGNTSSYLPANGQLTQFSIQLKVTAQAPLTIANIAQVFGQTPETNAPVFDESGDQNPSNFDGPPGNMTPQSGTDTNGDNVPDRLPPTVDDGFINNPGNPETGTDTNSDNTGVGAGGEANVLTLNPAAVLNGPKDTPEAVGPNNNNNDDFTNKSSLVPPGQVPGSIFDPGTVTFSNTVRNTSTEPVNISLLPTPPATPGDLPSGTEVKISYSGTSKTYVWNGSVFQYLDPAQGLSNINEASDYITIANAPVNGNTPYTVEVNLPSGTSLSTDINKGFPVPITAFVDDATAGLGTETARNTTIDRVYTGFLKLVKYSKIEAGEGPAVGTGQDDFETTPSSTNPGQSVGTKSPVARTPAKGNYIVYEIRYRNISEASVGTGNVILNAANVVITEDGNTATNNWAKDTDNNSVIDTSHVAGSAVDSGASTITFFSGSDPATNATSGTTVTSDVTKYVNTVTDPLAPSATPRTFTFKRRVN